MPVPDRLAAGRGRQCGLPQPAPMSRATKQGTKPRPNAALEEWLERAGRVLLTTQAAPWALQSFGEMWPCPWPAERERRAVNSLPDLRDPEFAPLAACSGTGTEKFFPDDRGLMEEAKAICAGCTVRHECLALAVLRIT
jgi:hypothetical protein